MSLAGQRIPTLSYSIECLERLMTTWEDLPDMVDFRAPYLQPYVDVGVARAVKHYRRMDLTDAYIISMCTS